MKNMLMTVALAGAFALPAAAQTGTGSSTAPKPATHATMHSEQSAKTVAPADKAFAHEAAIGGMAEVALGNLAKEKASSPDVKAFGDRMVNDHGKANDQLKDWAQKNDVTLPTQLDAKHKALQDRLSKLSGDAFDKAYMRAMLTDHKEDVAKFRTESKSARNSDLKEWAGDTLPTLQDHLKMAQDTASKVGIPTATSGKGHPKK